MRANKHEVRRAVETAFNVKVQDVNMTTSAASSVVLADISAKCLTGKGRRDAPERALASSSVWKQRPTWVEDTSPGKPVNLRGTINGYQGL